MAGMDYPSVGVVSNLDLGDVEYILGSQVRTVALLAPSAVEAGAADPKTPTYRDEGEFWRDVLSGRLRAGSAVILKDVSLVEWMPRSPGLYFTPQAEEARSAAAHFIERVDSRGSEIRYALSADDDKVTVYNPYGKMRMLQGGVGTVRLKPRVIQSLGDAWFMSATSSGAVHRGVPLAVPDHLYQRHIPAIADLGALRCDIRARLRFIPEELSRIYAAAVDVPQLYLEVSDLRAHPTQVRDAEDRLRVSIAVGFLSSYEGQQKMYSSWVYFNPARPGSFQANATWMDERYVQGKYQGRIVTDFDEQMRRFADASFSLAHVMDRAIPLEDARAVINATLGEHAFDALQRGLTLIDRSITVGNISNSTVAIGHHASVTMRASSR